MRLLLPVRRGRAARRAVRARRADRGARGHGGGRLHPRSAAASRPRALRAVLDRRGGAEARARLTSSCRSAGCAPTRCFPTRAYAGDAGLDLAACERVVLAPGERATVGTGVAVAIPAGYAGYVQPRSGLAEKHGITIVNTPGLVDSGYRGELRIILLNTDRERRVRGRAGHADRAARRCCRSRASSCARSTSCRRSERGERGFGSSGRLRWASRGSASRRSSAGAARSCSAGTRSPGKEYWLLPGGGVDSGESLDRRAAPRALGGARDRRRACPSRGRSRIVDSIAPNRTLVDEARRAHHLRRRPHRPLARGGALRGRRRARPPPLRARRARPIVAAPADPALPAPLAAGRPGRVYLGALWVPVARPARSSVRRGALHDAGRGRRLLVDEGERGAVRAALRRARGSVPASMAGVSDGTSGRSLRPVGRVFSRRRLNAQRARQQRDGDHRRARRSRRRSRCACRR